MHQLSIEDNLKRIITTKKYTMPLFSNFGLSDKFIDTTLSNELLLELKDEVLEQIRLYEPRIKVGDIRIECKDSSLILSINTEEESLALKLS